jgi:hypothetical protein
MNAPTAWRDGVFGRDFFAEVIPAGRLHDSHARFLIFMAQGNSTDMFSTTFPYGARRLKSNSC